MSELGIEFVDADEKLKSRVAEEWGEKMARHMHLENGFSILAMQGKDLVGLISVYWKMLPPPLPETCEGYIDILEVHKDFRRRGIAVQLIDMSLERAKEKGAYQMRSWSSLDKTEAIPMWKALGFGLCPATTFPGGQEVKGYFVTKLLNEPEWKKK
ncbi:MAG: GNAT family N-acetyltransferase [Anaerolineales bacterium]|nr:GNAT family N-acetyltransferase [Anaerolineales bacterium]